MNISIVLPIMVSAVGLYLLIKLKFFFLFHPIKTAREFIFGLKNRNSRKAFFLALAGTLGVGNIFGVAAGIMVGGPGSLFWLFVSTIFAMIIKYAETLLVFDVGVEQGGMASVLKSVFVRLGKPLSLLYAFLTIILALFMGCAMQSAALVDIAEKSLGLNPIITALILLILLIPIFVGGANKIESITEIVIPVTTIIYIFMCFAVIFSNFSKIPCVINSIISSAFRPLSVVGGGVSFIAVREGFARGILSNEAGAGTSALAHIRSRDRSAHVGGLFAMCEVVFDSSLLCMLTGISILLIVPDVSVFDTPMSLVSTAFSFSLGSFSTIILTFLILSFAYATIICWYYYGMECVRIYFPKIKSTYPLFFVISMLFSSAISSSFLIYLIDVVLLFMSMLTVSAILKRTSRISSVCL